MKRNLLMTMLILGIMIGTFAPKETFAGRGGCGNQNYAWHCADTAQVLMVLLLWLASAAPIPLMLLEPHDHTSEQVVLYGALGILGLVQLAQVPSFLDMIRNMGVARREQNPLPVGGLPGLVAIDPINVPPALINAGIQVNDLDLEQGVVAVPHAEFHYVPGLGRAVQAATNVVRRIVQWPTDVPRPERAFPMGECPICLEASRENCVMFNCGHVYHTACIEGQALTNCPQCRREISVIADLPPEERAAAFPDEEDAEAATGHAVGTTVRNVMQETNMDAPEVAGDVDDFQRGDIDEAPAAYDDEVLEVNSYGRTSDV